MAIEIDALSMSMLCRYAEWQLSWYQCNFFIRIYFKKKYQWMVNIKNFLYTEILI